MPKQVAYFLSMGNHRLCLDILINRHIAESDLSFAEVKVDYFLIGPNFSGCL